MALGKRKRHHRPVHLLTKRLQPTDAAGRLLLPQMNTGILPLMLRRDEVEAMGTASGLKIRVFDAAGHEHAAMYLKNINNSSCQLVGPRCRTFIIKNLIQRGARRRNNILVSIWAFRANTPGWRYRSPEEDPLWFARDLCLAITATTDISAFDDDAAPVRGEPIDSWRGVRPKPRSIRRRRTYPTVCTSTGRCTAAQPSSIASIAGAGGERHWVLQTSHNGRGSLVVRFIRAPNPIAI